VSGRFFTRTKSNRNVPQVRIDLASLADAFSLNLPLAHAGRCQRRSRTFRKSASALFWMERAIRLQKKSRAFWTEGGESWQRRSPFPGSGAALGYKENKLPFMLTAQRLRSRPCAKLNPRRSHVVRFRGILEAPDLGVYENQPRNMSAVSGRTGAAARSRRSGWCYPPKCGASPAPGRSITRKAIGRFGAAAAHWRLCAASRTKTTGKIFSFFRNPRPSLLEVSLHAGADPANKTDGAGGRIASVSNAAT